MWSAALRDELIADVGCLDLPEAEELHVYEAHMATFVADVDRAVLEHPRVDELLGGNPIALALSNHRNHATFMAEIFRAGSLADLVPMAVWAYRSYLSRGVHPDYWRVHLPAWRSSFDRHGFGATLARSHAIYAWLSKEHDNLLALAREPALVPQLDSELSASFAEHLRALDLQGCLAIVEGALERKTPLTAIVTELIDPALQLIGAGWEDGVLTTAHEHRATAIAQRLIGGVLAVVDLGTNERGTILVTSAESEFHDIGALSLAIYFEAAGWDVAYLGANTPNKDVAALAAEIEPAVVAVSVTVSGNLRSVRDLIGLLRTTSSARILVGGGLFKRAPTLARALDADCVTVDPVAAIQWAANL